MEGTARQDIAYMSGIEALPRRSGELSFHDEWERRVFALGVALCEQGEFDWDHFRKHLISSIAESGGSMEAVKPEGPGYYEHWLMALEKTLVEQGVFVSGESLCRSEES